MKDEYITRIHSFLRAHCIENYHFERTSRHRTVVVEHGDAVVRITFSSSGSDWRGPENAVADVRRALKHLLPQTSNNKERRRPKHKAKKQQPKARCHRSQMRQPEALERASPATDKFFGPLMQLKTQMLAGTIARSK